VPPERRLVDDRFRLREAVKGVEYGDEVSHARGEGALQCRQGIDALFHASRERRHRRGQQRRVTLVEAAIVVSMLREPRVICRVAIVFVVVARDELRVAVGPLPEELQRRRHRGAVTAFQTL
jgi:hypothetical protein